MANSPPPDRVSAVLMASGFSKRFDTGNKLLYPFRGKPLARYTLELVCASGLFADVFFVYADEAVAALAAGLPEGGLPVALIKNTAPEKGQRESIRLGVLAADMAYVHTSYLHTPHTTQTDYYMFFPCDQPLLDIDTVRLVVGARRPGCIVEPCFKEKPGTPCLFSATFRDELLNLDTGEHPRVIKARHPEAVIRVMVANSLVLADIDTSGDRPAPVIHTI